MKFLPYVIIGVLLALLLIPRKPVQPVETVIVDTLYDTLYVHDTIAGEPEWVYHHYDTTVWVNTPEHVPSKVYEELLQQYIALGNQLYSTNGYKTRFPIDTFGYVTVFDTIYSNNLISSVLVSDLKIPEKTIIIEKWRPQTRQLYFGGGVSYPFGAHTGLMYKDLKDRLLGFSIGTNGNGLNYNLSYYVKIK
jgi:hypothetical protein